MVRQTSDRPGFYLLIVFKIFMFKHFIAWKKKPKRGSTDHLETYLIYEVSIVAQLWTINLLCKSERAEQNAHVDENGMTRANSIFCGILCFYPQAGHLINCTRCSSVVSVGWLSTVLWKETDTGWGVSVFEVDITFLDTDSWQINSHMMW